MSITLTHPAAGMNTRAQAQLLTNQTDASDGEWVDVSKLFPFSITIKDVSDPDVLQVRVSSVIDQPADNTHGSPLGSNIRKGRTVATSHIFRWAKVQKKTGGGSATNAFLWGRYEVAR